MEGSVDSAGLPTEPRRYLTDLRLLTQLVASSWPRTRHLLPLTEFADAVDANLDQHGHDSHDADLEATGRRRQPWKPLAPATGACLLSIADHIVSDYDSADAREIVRELLPSSMLKTNRTGWAQTFTADRDECSPGFARTISPLVKRYSRQPRTTTYARAAILRTTLAPKYIPQWLSTDRFHRHFGHFDGISHYQLRRIATIRLFQMAFGGSAGNAADYLGFPTHVTTLGTLVVSDASPVQTWAHRRNDPDEFDRAVAALATDLEQNPRIDYHKRRLALRNWSIPPTRWAEIIDPLTHSRRVRLRPDHHRTFASTLVWATVTSGNRRYAPMAAQTNATQNAWAFPSKQTPNHLRIMKALDELTHELVDDM
ncbi:hypothetical protein OG874_08480 [Nocardia sp. NBC_00565]|uniref:hypothetical protein n=1 Tax=Nocardia sp. NBC_00565 TaxID=2975993 RepID=UPI002E82319D|nr:hypothetical protein [Nocardia sp. NBC_00565]WUC05166.1 hypothetical protein OG874_08480 [Nocardia sp. NBC_00565]